MGGKASKKAAQAAAPAGPLELLVEGGKVYLTSKATGKLLRVDEGAVDALGEEGESAQFTVGQKESESGRVVTLQSGDKYLAVSEEKVELCDESSELKVVEGDGGCVSFESGQAAGHYLSVQEDGSVQSGTEVGSATHFTVTSAVKKEEAPAKNATATEEEKAAEQQETAAATENEEQKTDEAPATEENESKEPEEQGQAQEQATSES